MGYKADRDLRRRVNPDEPVNVGAMAGQFQTTATLLVRAAGAWEYGEEIPIDVAPNACHELPFDDTRLLYWSGIEVTVRMKDLRAKFEDPGGRRADHYFVVAALEPANWGWAVCAPLRGENKHVTTAQRDEAIRGWVEEGCRPDQLTWDPFLRDPGKYAARLNDPMRLHYEGGRNLDNGFVIGTEPAGIEKAVWHFAICPVACLQELGLESEPLPASAVRPAHTDTVRVPRTQPADLAQAALWYACAGRADDDPVTLRRMQANAERALGRTE